MPGVTHAAYPPPPPPPLAPQVAPEIRARVLAELEAEGVDVGAALHVDDAADAPADGDVAEATDEVRCRRRIGGAAVCGGAWPFLDGLAKAPAGPPPA